MEPCKRGNKKKQRYGRYSNVEEPEYHVAEDQEEVNIHPARPTQSDRQYADRDLPRSSSTQSLCSNGSPVIPCPKPRRPIPCIPGNPGPAINRKLKPGRPRRTPIDERTQVMSRKQNMHISQRSPQFLTKDLQNLLSGLDLETPSRRDRQRGSHNVASITTSEDMQCSNTEPPNHTQRYSLDLDCPQDTERLHQRNNVTERTTTRPQNHEWPQTKDDVNQHDFVAMAKPFQTYNAQDWYIGPCDRAEAEHALHLVNKDGAYLVRDCSKNTPSEPFVLVVYHDKRVFNVKIRFAESTGKYVLGNRQRSNDMFETVADIIKFHSIFPVVLIDGRNISANKYQGNCVLTYPITKEDVSLLLA